jgi:hypothetical protein
VADITRLPGAQLYHWEWQRDAACRGMDSTLFFHPPNERDTCQGPARSAHWRPADLPTGGHEFCRVVAMKLPSIAPGPEVVDHVSGVTP